MKFVISLPIALVVILCATGAICQETTGNIEGQLVDQDGQPIAYANIFVTSPDMLGSRGTLTSSRGDFRILKLPVGHYTVRVSHISYNEMEFKEVSVRLGQTTTLGRIELSTRVHEAPTIEVTAERKLIDPSTSSIGANLTNDEFGELPIDRDYKNIPTLIPYVNESFLGDEANFAGGTGHENKYFIDGADATEPYIAYTGTNLPYNFVKDIEVKAGGYEAEYRSSLGGIVNVVSHSGSNEFHGQVFGFFVNNQFQGTPRIGVAEPSMGDFTQYDMGFSLGGPVIRDKLWFYVAYNPTFNEEDVEIPGTGFHVDKSIMHIFSGKLDWRAGDKTNLTLTVTGDPSYRDAVGVTFGDPGPTPVTFENPDPFLVRVETGGVNVFAKGTHLLSDNAILEASISGIKSRIMFDGLTELGREEILFVDTETGVWSGGYVTPTNDRSLQITADVAGTFVLGPHTLKSGLGYRDNKLDVFEEFIWLARVNDPMIGEYFGEIYYKAGGTIRNRIPSAFIQDSWKVTQRFLINAGLRWDSQYLYGVNGDIIQEVTNELQPRIGLVYQPGELGTQKIFASYGRFYQELALALAVNTRNEESAFIMTMWDHDPRIDPSGGIIVNERYGTSAEPVDGLKGQHFDEFTLGYERQIGGLAKIGVSGVYRILREAITTGNCGDGFGYDNPGEGILSCLPDPEREYKALILNLQTYGAARYFARASYVLSENKGNYPGLFVPAAWQMPNINPFYSSEEGTVNSYGLLPNDRTHVFKVSAYYRWDFGLTAGSSLSWMTGTPLSIYEGASAGPPDLNFAVPRGSNGRTPDIWDLNLRFAYDLGALIDTKMRPRIIMDVFHLFSQREPVTIDEIKNFDQDDEGNQIALNPTFGMATSYQPPTSVRVGFELNF
jgi:hypothetical protein